MKVLRLIQETQARWRLESTAGRIILKDLMLESRFRAEDWIRGYVSSFLGYTYEVVPLNQKQGEKKP